MTPKSQDILICDISALDYERAKYRMEDSPIIRSYVEQTADPVMRKQRLGAFLLLKGFDSAVRDIGHNKRGCPYIYYEGDRNLNVSISHKDDLVAAVLYYGGEKIGIDIEKEMDTEREERIQARFLDRFCFDGVKKYVLPEIIYRTYATSPDGRVISGRQFMKHHRAEQDVRIGDYAARVRVNRYDSNPTSLWTAMEAILKLNGQGFFDFPEPAHAHTDIWVDSIKMEYKGHVYYLTLAVASAE